MFSLLLLATVVSLAGEWRLEGRLERGQRVVCPCKVPGGIHSALLAAKKIKHPFVGMNELDVQWVGRKEWEISRRFDVPDEILSKHEIVLRVEDVDTFATISINGRVVGKTGNRFQRHEFDIKPFLRRGENEIKGVFESAESIGNMLADSSDHAEFWMCNSLFAKNMAFVRKPACHAGWDWGPAIMVTGFCGKVEIIASDESRLEYVYCDQKFNSDLSHCTLTATAVHADGSKDTRVFEVDRPPLWWPNGYGEQKFFEFEFAGKKHRIGLRKLEVLNERTLSENGKEELSLVFRINNRRIFAKGANWIPCSALENEQTDERYRDLLESARASNMNMIRLWGGGQYEKDIFYNLCDELGLLVWHDMMFSCAAYSGDADFLGEVRKELQHQILRLRDHASIALWCGDNECIPGARKEPYRTYWLNRSKMQAECVAAYDPSRTYWPSSPCCGPGDFGDAWKEDSKGDMHNWRVWHDNCPFDEYYRFRPRFCSEFGYQSFPSMEVAETFASRADIEAHGPHFEWHQKGGYAANSRIRETMARYFPAPANVESELLLSQIQHGMAMKMACDAWRAQRPRCMGTLFWQLNDNWPVSSWSSIEYGGKWKPVQHLARRFYAPVNVVAQPEIRNGKADVTRGKIFALNDTSEHVSGRLLIEHWTYDGKIVSTEIKSILIPPDSSTEVGEFHELTVGDQRQITFLVLTLKTSQGVCQNDWHFGFYKDMPLAKAIVQAKVRENDGRKFLVLSTDKPAFFVWANVRGVRGEFSDNALTLLPGRQKEIEFIAKQDVGSDTFRNDLTVRDLRSLCKPVSNDPITRAWRRLMTRFYVPKIQGFLDFTTGEGEDGLFGELPTPKEIAACKPCVTGWCTGMENGMLNAGPFVLAAIRRWELTGDEEAREDGRKLFWGMVRNGEQSGVKGFVIRTISPLDGKSFYPNSSRDQYTLYVYAMWKVVKSDVFGEAEKSVARRLLSEIAAYAEKCVTEKNGYRLLGADGKPAWCCQMWMEKPGSVTQRVDGRDYFGGLDAHEVMRLPMFFAAAWDATGDAHWRNLELKYVDKGYEMAKSGALPVTESGFAVFQAQISHHLLYSVEPDLVRKENIMQLLRRFSGFAEEEAKRALSLFRDRQDGLYAAWPDWRTLPLKPCWENGLPMPFWGDEFARIFSLREIPESILNVVLMPGGVPSEESASAFEELIAKTDFDRVTYADFLVHVLMAYWYGKELEVPKCVMR